VATIDLTNLGADGVSLFGPEAYAQLGRSIDSAGDVNGDGIEDFIIAQLYTDSGGPGGAYILFGQVGGLGAIDLANLTPSQGVFLQGPASTRLTEVVSSAGDVNGDGFDDVLIGDPRFDSYEGRAYLVYGQASFSSPVELGTLSENQGRE
jgi:hypothetical protein